MRIEAHAGMHMGAEALIHRGAIHTPRLLLICSPAGIPAMSMNVRDQARRFITLVDELYNARCLLICSAACPPDQLFAAADGKEEPIIDLEGLQFETAVEGKQLDHATLQSLCLVMLCKPGIDRVSKAAYCTWYCCWQPWIRGWLLWLASGPTTVR